MDENLVGIAAEYEIGEYRGVLGVIHMLAEAEADPQAALRRISDLTTQVELDAITARSLNKAELSPSATPEEP